MPTQLEAHVGNGLYGYFGVHLEGEQLLYSTARRSSAGRPDAWEEVETTPEAWKRFWRSMDQIGAWEWAESYSDPSVLDGTYWGMRLSNAGKQIESSGANAYPEGNAFPAFCRAISKLIGGRPFE